MKENNSVYINMHIRKKEIENIKNVNKMKDYERFIGTLSLSITIDGEGYVIPIKTEKSLNKKQIYEIINSGKYNIQEESVNISFELKPTEKIEEDPTPEMMCF